MTDELVDPEVDHEEEVVDEEVDAPEEEAAEVEVAARTGAVGSAVPDLPVLPEGSEMSKLAAMAVTLAHADAVPKALRRKPNDVFLVLLTARDLGVSLTAAMREFHVIEGRVTLSPKVRVAMVRQSGVGRLWPEGDNDAHRATWHGAHRDYPEATVSSTFSWEDARLAGLVDGRCAPDRHWSQSGKSCFCKDNWKRYPKRMLSWRAVGYLLDDLFPEVGTGLYSPDELGAVTDADGNAIQASGVEALPGMTGSRGAIVEAPASAEEREEIAARIAGLPDDLRDVFVDWWKAEIGVKVDALPARLVAKAQARLDWTAAQVPEPEPEPSEVDEPTVLVEVVIAEAQTRDEKALRGDFEAHGLRAPRMKGDGLRRAWSEWRLGVYSSALLAVLSAGAITLDDAAEAFAEVREG